MAIAAVTNLRQIRVSNFATNTSTALPNNVTSGNLLVIIGGIWNTSANSDIAFSAGAGSTATLGTMTTIIESTGISYAGGTGQAFISYGFVTGNGSLTILTDPQQAAGNYIACGTIEFSGVHATPLDVNGGELYIPSGQPVDSITTLTANDLILGVMIGSAGTLTFTPGASYTQIDEDESGAQQAFAAEYRIATTATNYTVDWTSSLDSEFSILNVALKESTAPPADSLIGAFMMA